MSSSKRESMANSPPTDIIKLIRSMFEISNQHVWVSDFLFTPDTLSVPDVVTDLQKASAVISSIQVRGRSGRSSSLFSEKFALIPVFSNGNISTGILVKKQDSETSSSKGRYASSIKARIAFDNRNTSFLAVFSPSGSGNMQVLYVSNHVQEGARIASLDLNESVFRNTIFNGRVSASLLLNSMKKCECYFENRERCVICLRKNSRKCRCSHNTFTPKHPLDFNCFAPNIVLLDGEFPVSKISWRGSGHGLVTNQVVRDLLCKISISVDEKKVSKMCSRN